MNEAKTTPTKSIFLDVVGFTNDRSVEAQVDVVGTLNRLVKESLDHHNITRPKRILLPTGDGLCIVLLDVKDPYDIHIRIALSILGILEKHNSTPDEKMRASRKFQVRIGISQNDDTLVTDINGRRNIAGAGINTAQRVMDKADGSQILVSQTVYEHLRHREKYMESFAGFAATTKHDEKVNVYQLVNEGVHGLDVEIPSAFRAEEDSELTKLVAYFIAHATVNRDLLLPIRDSPRQGATILLYNLARDSVASSEATKFDVARAKTWKSGAASFEEQLAHYNGLTSHDFWASADLARLIEFRFLEPHKDCFVSSNRYSNDYRFVTENGHQRIREEWPEIWSEFKLDEYV